MDTKNYIVVTGATGELGSEIVKLLNEIYPEEKVLCISRSGKNPNPQSTNNIPLIIDLATHHVDSTKCLLEHHLKDSVVKFLINCSGVCKSLKFSERTPSSISQQINVNLTSYMVICNIVLPYMVKGSHIVNISSLMGRIPMKYYSVYSATKFSIVGFSESLRMELEDSGILVSCVLPSLFHSRMSTDAVVPDIVKPANVKTIAKETVSLLGVGGGLKTIGLQSALSCIVERLMPAINRTISTSLT